MKHKAMLLWPIVKKAYNSLCVIAIDHYSHGLTKIPKPSYYDIKPPVKDFKRKGENLSS